MKKILIFSLVMILLISCDYKKTENSNTIDIISITDFHGQLTDYHNNPVGSILTKKIKDIYNSNPNGTLILGGGDLYQGSPTSNILEGVPVAKMFSNMKMDTTTLGNHEFDWNLDTIINTTMTHASYDIICSNLYNQSMSPVFKPYRIITKKNISIGIIGALTLDTPNTVLPAQIKGYTITDPIEEINKYAEEVKTKEKVDAVIVLIHEGAQDLVHVVKQLKNVDLVFGGHTHTIYDHVIKSIDKEVPTIIANSMGKGYAHVKMNIEDNKISFSTNNYKELDLSLPTDTKIDKIVSAAQKKVGDIFNESLGTIPRDLHGPGENIYDDSHIGNWMADVIRDRAKTDISFMNTGGVRINIIDKGNITFGTIYNLMPFDNTIATINITGSDLKILLNQAYKDGGKGIQVSGFSFEYDRSKKDGDRIQNIYLSNGKKVQSNDSLTLSGPNFLLGGKDGFTHFLKEDIQETFKDTLFLIREALHEHVSVHKTIEIKDENRIINLQNSKDKKAS